MLKSWIFSALVGTVLGFLTGLGAGGGSLLLLWLTQAAEFTQENARAVNLLFFIPSAAIACVFRKRQGAVDLPRTIPAALAGCIAAALFTLLSARLDLELLRRLFGVLLLATGLRELFYRDKKAR